ncbi:MAG: hypothetical protein ABL921_19340 [Pirellula sp.]
MAWLCTSIRWILTICLLVVAFPAIGLGQPRVQLPYYSYQANPWGSSLPPQGMFAPGGYIAPSYNTPSATSFDPYSPGFRPTTAPPAQNWGLGSLFNWGQPAYPTYPQNIPLNNSSPYLPAPYSGVNPYPPSVYPNASPNVLFPSTSGAPPLNSTWNFQNQTAPYGLPQYNSTWNNNWNNWWNGAGNNFSAGTNQVARLFQGPRVRHTWLPGTDSFNDKRENSLETNDTDVSFVFAVPNFLGTTRPLYIIPSYSQHVWEGPKVAGSDLPGSAFSGFLDTGWESNPIQTLGYELGVRVGVFSAFDAINTNSIRIQGKALGRLRLTPTATLRAGVFYIDRNKIKLLPAGGILWMPNQDTRFDIFFPEPKLSHYLATLGNSDMWWYLTGYYGGGAWTIKQTDGASDEIDINDIRLMMGLEFGRSDQIRQGFRVGFVEGGYAFNRELLYRVRSASSLDLENSFVLRAGFAY